jgi:hypothetical protein
MQRWIETAARTADSSASPAEGDFASTCGYFGGHAIDT